MATVSIVVPVYHNAPSLLDLFAQFKMLAERNNEDRFEFIFVDDGSKDDSFNILTHLSKQDKRIKLVKLSRNFGSNAAVLAGIGECTGDVAAGIAADLQDPPELINDMLDSWRQGNKVVLAARKERDDPGLTSLIADAFYILFRRFAIKTMPRRGFDFFLIDKQVYTLINNIQENNAYLMGLILWLGFDPKVIYYNRRKREERYGHSMWTFAKKIKYFMDSFVAFSYVPVRAASLLGITVSILGLLYAVVIVFARLFLGTQVEGWASLMIVVLIVAGAQLLMTGILGEYMWRNLDETRRRPRFIIDQIVQTNESNEQCDEYPEKA